MRIQRLSFFVILTIFVSFRAWGMACDAQLAKGYVGLFKLAMQTPYLTLARAIEIANSSIPLDPLEEAPRDVDTLAIKERLRGVMPKITSENWVVIQKILREHLQISQHQARQVEVAKEATRLIFAPFARAKFDTPEISVHGTPDHQISFADRSEGDRLYFVGTNGNYLHVIEDKLKKNHKLDIPVSVNSTIQIYQETPNRWLLLFASKMNRSHSIFTATFNPQTLTLETGPTALAEPGIHNQTATDFEEIRDLNWVSSPEGQLHYTYTNFGGTWFGRIGSSPEKLKYETNKALFAESVPSTILRMKGGRVLLATIGLDEENKKCLFIFEPFRSFSKPLRKFRDPETTYHSGPALIQYKNRVYAAAVGYTQSRVEKKRYVDFWDVTGNSEKPHSIFNLDSNLALGGPRFFVTSKGRLLLAQRLNTSEHAFHMKIFAPFEQPDPVYELTTDASESHTATQINHFPKLIENVYGELLVAGISRIDHLLYIFKPEESSRPAFTYDFDTPYALAPSWSPRENGKLDLIFGSHQGKTRLMSVMIAEDKD